MKLIYRKHQTSNGMNYQHWDDEYYLCDSIEEYNKTLKDLQDSQEAKRIDYAKRGYARFTPYLSKEGKIEAREYYYGHEWTGKNFTAYGFSYRENYEYGSVTKHYLKPDSMSEITYPSHNDVGWMYGS